jgi:histidinol dehydrogenase
MDQYTQLQKMRYESQIKMNQKGIEALEKVISQFNEIKESINSITEGTIENKLSDIIEKAKNLVKIAGEKLKNIENMYEKELENIRKAEEKIKPNK